MQERVPDAETLRRYSARGMSFDEMAIAWYADAGVRPSRSQIASALKQHGIALPEAPRQPYGKIQPKTRNRIEGVIILFFLAIVLYPLVGLLWRAIT